MGAMKELMIEIEDALLEDMAESSAETIAILKVVSRKLSEAQILLSSQKSVFDAVNLPVSEAVGHVARSLENDLRYLGSLSEILSSTSPAVDEAALNQKRK